MMRLLRTAQGVLLGAVSALSLLAQTGISIGVKGGVPLNDAFADRSFNYQLAVRTPFGSPISEIPQTTRVYGGSRYFALGPTVELLLPRGFGVEVDALYRPMEIWTQANGGLANFLLGRLLDPEFSSHLDTWEFPILAKYRLPLPLLQPYVEAGPAFRAVSDSLAENMSSTGVSAGIGLEFPIGHLRYSPEIRYTHWGNDGSYSAPYHAVSHSNQVEFLVGLATSPTTGGFSQPSHAGLWNHVSVGVKGGIPFTDAFISDQFARVTYPPVRCGDFTPHSICQSASPTVQTFSASRNYLVGPMVEIQFPYNISIESDALYAPLSIAALASPLLVLPSPPSIRTFGSWQFSCFR